MWRIAFPHRIYWESFTGSIARNVTSPINKTKRSTRIRVKEHMASARNGHPEVSATAEHALIHDHRLAWEKATPIDHARNTRQRRVKEALWIHSLEGKLMNRDHGIELNPLWLELIRSD